MTSEKIRIAFFGTPDFAVPTLESLLSDPQIDVRVVATQPDKPAGRHHAVAQKSPIKKLAEKNNIPVHDDSLDRFSHDAEIGVLVAYGNIVPQKTIDSFKYGVVNIHPSLLPRYRGSSPVQAAIRNRDEATGVSIMALDKKMDHGPILAQETVPLSGIETAGSLTDTLAHIGARMLSDTIKKYTSGTLKPSEQEHDAATYTQKISKDDGRIDWSLPSADIDAHVRAMTPWPGAWTTWKNKRLIVWRSKGGIPVEVQPEGKKRMDYDSFLRGQPDFSLDNTI